MGWVQDGCEEHEGWIVAYVLEARADLDATWHRELSAAQGDNEPCDQVAGVGAACACGWRSQRFDVYNYEGTSRVVYWPYTVHSRTSARLAPTGAFGPDRDPLPWGELETLLHSRWTDHVRRHGRSA